MNRPDLSSSDKLHQAIAHHQAGRISDAERLYVQILEIEPENPNALHLLGLLFFHRGQFDDAIELLQKAVANNKRNAKCFGDLAIVLNTAKRFQEAEVASRKAIELDQNLNGVFNSLGLALEGQGKFENAVSVFQKGMSVQPHDINIGNNLGNMFARSGKYDDAIDVFRRALKVDENYDEAHAGLGKVLGEIGLYDEAIAECELALKLNPHNLGCINNLGLMARKKNNFPQAIEHFSEVLSVSPTHDEALLNLAATYASIGDEGNALKNYELYAQTYGQTPAYLNGLGMTKLNFGYLDEAIQFFNAAIEGDPQYVEAYYNLHASPKYDFDDKQIENIKNLLLGDHLSSEHLSKLNFIMGDINRKNGNVDAAYRNYESGNESRRIELIRRNRSFDVDGHLNYIEKLKAYFTPEFFNRRNETGLKSKLPVFVIGMPRSGTTLVHQIAATHSKVFGAGELTGISDIIDKLRADNYPASDYPYCLDKLSENDILEMAQFHFEFLNDGKSNAERVVDKMPFNFLHLGFIYCLFPEAKIIHCQRNLLDIGILCFFQNFVNDLPWSTNLVDIGKYIAGYLDIMQHWERVLPIPILNLTYEKLVQEQENESKKIIEFIDLEWDENCLNYFDNRNMVTTASNWQVREPIYTSSVYRWREYESHLKPLITELDGLI